MDGSGKYELRSWTDRRSHITISLFTFAVVWVIRHDRSGLRRETGPAIIPLTSHELSRWMTGVSS